MCQSQLRYYSVTKKQIPGAKLDKMREEVFEQVFRAGAIRSVRLVVRDARAVISYCMGDGTDGFIHTKRGEVKAYRVETALGFLRRCGVALLEVDMRGWEVGQAQLV